MCNCLNGFEDVEHFLSNCHDFTYIRNILMSNVSQKLNVKFSLFTPKKMIETLSYGNKKNKQDVNTYILTKTIIRIKGAQRRIEIRTHAFHLTRV